VAPFLFNVRKREQQAEVGDWSEKSVVATRKCLVLAIGIRRMAACISVGLPEEGIRDMFVPSSGGC
jgi:hypothetical protein